MDFIIKFEATVVNKDNSISKKCGDVNASCDLTLEEFKKLQNDADVLLSVKRQLKKDFPNKVFIEVNIYDIVEKKIQTKKIKSNA